MSDNINTIENVNSGDEQKQPEKKEVKLSKKEKSNLEQEHFEQNLEGGFVVKNKSSKKPPVFKPIQNVVVKTKLYNENGELLTKKGKVDKRTAVASINGKKRYQQLLEQSNKNKPQKTILTPVVESDSDDDDEFEIEIEQPIKAPIPVLQPKIPDPVILQQIEQRKKMDEDLISKLKKENDDLKQGLAFKQQLARLEGKSRIMQCKWT
jgi:hypothetical protein